MAWPNQPSTGHAVKTNWDCDSLATSGGWVDAYNGSSLMSLVDNQDGPDSPPSALQGFYPIGHPGGSGVGNFNFVFAGTREMYVGMLVKMSNPFQHHPDGDKICYYAAQGGNAHPAYSLLRGGSRMDIVAQADSTVDNTHLPGVVFTGTCILTGSVSNWSDGAWHRFEVFLRESTSKTSRDGIFRWWVDGTLVGNYTNVNTAQLGGFTGPVVNPVYGGGTQVSKTENDYIWYDQIIVTGGDSGGGSTPPDTSGTTGLIQGSRTTPTQDTVFNLTSEGVTDWCHWGTTTASSVDGKSGGTSISRTPVSINGSTYGQFGGYPCVYAWSNGSPTGTMSSNRGGIYIDAPNQGLRITVPADTTQRTLKIWGNAYQVSARLTAALSDNSASSYIDNGFLSNTDQWTIVYRAGSANQSLSVTIEALSPLSGYTYGNVSLQAAALTTQGAVLPAPTITGFLPTSGLELSTVVLSGTNFDPLAANNTVKFNGTTGTVTSASSTSLTVVVPTGATTGPITVTTAGGTAQSGSNFTVNAPPPPVTPPEASQGGSAMMILMMP